MSIDIEALKRCVHSSWQRKHILRAWNNLNILACLFAPDQTISIVAKNNYAPLEIVSLETKILRLIFHARSLTSIALATMLIYTAE